MLDFANKLIDQLPAILTSLAALIGAIYAVRAHNQGLANQEAIKENTKDTREAKLVSKETNQIVKEANPEATETVKMMQPPKV